MRVLLDHNLPHGLRRVLAVTTHEIITAGFLGWGSLKNGELINAAEQAGFDVFVTGDLSLVHEQNLATRRLAILVLSTNVWPIVKKRVSEIARAIDNAIPGAIREVDCGVFTRRTPRT